MKLGFVCGHPILFTDSFRNHPLTAKIKIGCIEFYFRRCGVLNIDDDCRLISKYWDR